MRLVTSFLTNLSTKHSKLTLSFAIIIAILSLWHAKTYLKFDTDQDNLISKSQGYLQDYKAFLHEFGDWEYIYVVINLNQSTPNVAKSLSAELTERLRKKPELYQSLVNKIDISQIRKSFLLLAPEKDFKNFIDFVQKNPNEIQNFLNIRSSADWYAYIDSLFAENITSKDEKELEKYWPFLKSALYAPFEQNSLKKLEQTNLLTLLSGKYMDPDGYLFAENGKLLFIRIMPQKDYSQMEIIGKPLKYLRSQIEDLRAKYPDLEFGITGRPVLQNDEATSTQSDSELAGIAAFLLVALLFFIFFRGYKRSLFSLFALLIGISWTTGFISIVYGSINLITIVFAIILIGLGIDYGIHFLIRYQTERLSGFQTAKAISITTHNTGAAIIIGALTSAIAFATALLTDFLGLQQLGIIAGTGIVLCCFAQLTVFPSLLNLFDKRADKTDKFPSFEKLLFLIKKPKLTLTIAAIITIICLPLAWQTSFSSNILEMQDENLESVRFEKVIQDNSDISTWFLAYKTKDLNELRRVDEKIKKLSTVKTTQSILDVLPRDQDVRIKMISKLNQSATSPQPPPKIGGGWGEVAITHLQSNFIKLANDAFKSGMVDEFEELNAVSEKLNSFISILKTDKTPKYESGFMSFILESQNLLKDLLSAQAITENKLPGELLTVYKGKTGYYSLTIYPNDDIWDPQNMENFITDVRAIIPAVTGNPITNYESSKKLTEGFVLVGILTSILVLIIIFLSFRDVKISLIIYGNLLVTFIWLLAFMKLKGISINLANFFALPVLIGSGIDHGVHIFHRFRENHSLNDLFSATIPAITLSCLTTIFGFGALSFVRHKGLASFGLIMAAGTFFILLSSVIILPNIAKFIEKAK